MGVGVMVSYGAVASAAKLASALFEFDGEDPTWW